jgi:hypothetical protein
MNATAPTAAAHAPTRDEILAEIDSCETRLLELRAMLPTTIKAFYRFRVRPGKYAWVYADSRETADRKLRERMNRDYPPDEMNRPRWEIASHVVDVYHDAVIAAVNAPGNLLTCISAADAAEFARDFRDNARGRVDDPNRPKHLPKSQLERDVELYEIRQRQESR